MTKSTDQGTLLKTPLYDLHIAAGAKMVPFAGFSMPVQYPLGVKKEHLHTRNAVGIFDVSHMGQLWLSGDGGAEFLETLVPVDIVDLPAGKQKYALFTNEQGGVLDDLMVANIDDGFFIVVNAACKNQDIDYIKAKLPEQLTLTELNHRALLALQGPKAALILETLVPGVSDMVFMDVKTISLDGVDCIISRSGYTGEDGFEISIPQENASWLASRLCEFSDVEWVGLGARDSLRLESGLCLYGHDLNQTTTPVEASLLWAISPSRRKGGLREGGFPGDNIILDQIETKSVNKKRVGLVGITKAPVREGCELFNSDDEKIGIVTSGTVGPTVGKAISMAYIEIMYSSLGTEVFADVRGKKLAVIVEKMPFVLQRYYRG